jgi:HPt (histidine-containing phosphotransfer) domain-containing protein
MQSKIRGDKMIDTRSINIEDLTCNIGIDKDTVIELLDIYCRDMSEEIQRVKLFHTNQDWVGLQRTIHNIKGVSANLYLQDMFKAAEQLDERLKKCDFKGIEHCIQDLLHTFDETLKSINIISKQP